jgi:hypothetical protein
MVGEFASKKISPDTSAAEGNGIPKFEDLPPGTLVGAGEKAEVEATAKPSGKRKRATWAELEGKKKPGAKPAAKSKAKKAKPAAESKKALSADELSGAVDAVESESIDSTPDLKAPEIQPPGNFPTAEDAYADMSQPPPAQPVEFLALNHGSQVPRDAFRAIPQAKYISLFMFSLPYGTSMQGEQYVQPVAANILDKFRKECPQLILKRFELHLLLRADGSFYFLEVLADPAHTPKAEMTRQSLLRLLKVAEQKWVIGEKIAGIWGVGDSTCTTPFAEPRQPYKELVDRTYGDEIHRDMNRPVLQRFRKKV